MEQTNLIVTPDGKSWDEVTRDTSYLGNVELQTTTNTGFASGSVVIMDEWRGVAGGRENFNKDFAIAYNRYICLKEGWYELSAMTIAQSSNQAGGHAVIYVNGTMVAQGHTGASNHSQAGVFCFKHLQRGDYVHVQGAWYAGFDYSLFLIKKIG